MSDTNGAPDEATKRLFWCSGKVAYDLIEGARRGRDRRHPDRPDRTALPVSRGPRLPTASRGCRRSRTSSGVRRNRRTTARGSFVRDCIEASLAQAKSKVRRARYAGARQRLARHRPRKRHAGEQGALVADALGLGPFRNPPPQQES
jgi:2-oxoglutarate dehydrogenase E1 component